MKQTEEIENHCKKLKPILGTQADKLWHMYLAEDAQDRKKFAQDIELIVERFLREEPLGNQRIFLEPPHKNDSNGEFLLGTILYNKEKVGTLYLRQKDFLKQVGIFAITGEGKTNLAYLLALQLLKTKTPFMVIDWKRSWRNLLSLADENPDLKNARVFTIGRSALPFLWNVFRAPPGTDKNFWVGTIAEALERSHLSGPGVAYYFNKIYSKVYKGIPDDFYPNFFDGLREIQKIRVVGREQYWKQTALRIFQSFTLGRAAKVFNARSPIKLEELLEGSVILELDLEMPKPLRVFFSEMILRWIHLYRLSQGETDKLKHVLFLEEVHNLFTEAGLQGKSNSLENLYREIRGFGQGLVSITQHPSLLPIELLGNCHTQIFLGLQHADDVESARKSLFLEHDEGWYLNALDVGECIVKVKNRIEPCLVKTPLVPVKKGLVTDEWLRMFHLGSLFWEHSWRDDFDSFLSLKKSVAEILAGEILKPEKEDARNTLGKNNTLKKKANNTQGYYRGKTTGNISGEALSGAKRVVEAGCILPVNTKDKKEYSCESYPKQRLLIDILENPFSSITGRYKRLGFHPNLGNKCRRELISAKCIVPRKIVTGTGRLTLFELTKKGKLVLADLGFSSESKDSVGSSEGIVHRFWKHRAAEFYRGKGFDVAVEEYFVNGRPDLIVRDGDKRIAVEIETGKSDFVRNVSRALEAGFDEVICVGVDKAVEGLVLRGLGVAGVLGEKVRVVGVGGF